MVVQKEFLNKLKDFGLNSYESKLWVALLSRGVSTAGELSDISNVPRSRAYDVLESLEKKGFIVVKIGKPIKYLAVPPAEVIERVKKRVLEEAQQKNTSLSKLKNSEILTELNALHSDGVKLVDPTDRAGAFRGRERAYDHLSFMIKNAQKSVLLATSSAGLERKVEAIANPLKKAAKSGVDITIVAPKKTNKTVVERCEEFAQVMLKDGEHPRFCLIDDKEALFFLTDDKKVHKNYDSAVWMEAPHFVGYLRKLVE